MLTILIYVLSFLLVAFVSGNNLSSSSGAIISSGIVRKRTGIAIAILGYALGFLIEGGLLKAGLLALMPAQSQYLVILALAIVFAIFAVAHILRVPQSLSITFTMAVVGIELGYGNAINTGFVMTVIAFWVISALLAILITIISMRFLYKRVLRSKIWSTVGKIKLLLIIVSFFSAFVIGANTIGFLFSATSGFVDPHYSTALTIIAIILGSTLLSSGELRRIGNDIIPLRYLNALVSQTIAVLMVEIATAFSIPASNIQMFTASIYGAGLSYRTRLILKKPVITIVTSWISTALISFALGFAATVLIYHP